MDLSGRLLMSNVNSVLDLARDAAGKLPLHPVPADLDRLLQNLVDGQKQAAAANGTVLDWHWIGPPRPLVMVDVGRLQQIMLNLIGNAIKFTQGGQIRLAVECLEEPPPGPDSRWFALTVTDSGIGIAQDRQAHIFDDFVTGAEAGHQPGTGLGLGIARRLVRLMGGEITLVSSLGAGSSFCLRLPLPLHKQTLPGPTTEPVPSLPPMTILIVEDNDINRQVLAEMLRRDGHEVSVAEDGHTGVKAAGARRFDLILMDLGMPVMDGYQATRAIRNGNGLSNGSPILALTANLFACDPADLQAQGFDAHLTKPLRPADLFTLLSRFAPTEEVLVDHRQLMALQDDVGAAYASLAGRFSSEIDGLLTAEITSDLPQLAAESHKIASSAALFGASRCKQILCEVERAAKAGDRKRAAAELATLRTTWTATRVAMALADSPEQAKAGVRP
ncbi:MAG: ATP-binding protein, partial [Rhodobacteraceae bacterium]|nr:ATP-binding protein [Paracoccaceae bacterium]